MSISKTFCSMRITIVYLHTQLRGSYFTIYRKQSSGTEELYNLFQVTANSKAEFIAKMYGLQTEPCADTNFQFLVAFVAPLL